MINRLSMKVSTRFVAVFVFGLLIVPAIALAQWREPDQLPPQGNVPRPLNQGTQFIGEASSTSFVSGVYANQGANGAIVLKVEACPNGQTYVANGGKWSCGTAGGGNQDLLQVLTNGSDASTFTGSTYIGGAVGINVASTAALPSKLQVQGDTGSLAAIIGASQTGSGAIIGANLPGLKAGIYAAGAAGEWSGYFYGGQGVYIEQKLGIGTETPDAKLDVAGTVRIVSSGPDVFRVQSLGGSGLSISGDGAISTFGEQFNFKRTNDQQPGGAINSDRGLYININQDTPTDTGQFRINNSNGSSMLAIDNNGGVAIGQDFQVSGSAIKLGVQGKFLLKDGSEGTGKVLVSDANGLATWQTPTATGGGSAYFAGTNIAIASNTISVIPNPTFAGNVTVNGQELNHVTENGFFVNSNEGLQLRINRNNGTGDFGINGNGATGSRLVTVTNGGNVGINTVAPSSKLDIASSTSVSGVNDILTIRNNNITANTEAGIFFSPSTAVGNIRGARISGVQEDGSNSIGLRLRTSVGGVFNDAVTVRSSGNVGIGDTSPFSLLTVGSGDVFQVSSAGDLIRIKNIPYTWPTTQGAANTVLTNNGTGTLTWAAAASAGPWTRVNPNIIHPTTLNDSVGIGTVTPDRKLDITAPATAQIALNSTPASGTGSWDGIVIQQNNVEKWYTGVNGDNASADYVIRRNRSANDLTIQNSSGNVGIGITSPESLLSVGKSVPRGRGGEISIANTASPDIGNEAALNLSVGNTVSNNNYGGDAGDAQIKARSMASNNATDLIFSTYNGTSFGERMRIQAGGRVGIGTATPQDKLDIYGGSLRITDNNNISAGLTIQSGSSDWNMKVINSSAGGNAQGSLIFFHGSGGGTDNGALSISESGNVSIGNSNFAGNNSASKLLVGGNTTIGGNMYVTGGVRMGDSIATATPKPNCDSTNRGLSWFTQGATGFKDTYEICAKDAANTYAWRTLY